MNHLSRQGIIALLAAAVTTTSIAERSSSSQCTDGGNYSNEVPLPGSLGYCPGIDVVNGFTRPFQYQDDFPGNFPFPTEPRGNSLRVPQIYSSNGFWVEGKKTETLTCFKSKGYNLNVDVYRRMDHKLSPSVDMLFLLQPKNQILKSFSLDLIPQMSRRPSCIT